MNWKFFKKRETGEVVHEEHFAKIPMNKKRDWDKTDEEPTHEVDDDLNLVPLSTTFPEVEIPLEDLDGSFKDPGGDQIEFGGGSGGGGGAGGDFTPDESGSEEPAADSTDQ